MSVEENGSLGLTKKAIMAQLTALIEAKVNIAKVEVALEAEKRAVSLLEELSASISGKLEAKLVAAVKDEVTKQLEVKPK
jgi:hypothetical protein